MKEVIKSFSAAAELEGITLELVRHRDVKEMRQQIQSQYIEKKEGLACEVNLDEAFGFTIGGYRPEPRLTVFIPCGLSKGEYNEIVPHEAVHAGLAVFRHKTQGEMYPEIPIDVSVDTSDPHGVEEEELAIMIGKIAMSLWTMMEVVESEMRRTAFLKGITWPSRGI